VNRPADVSGILATLALAPVPWAVGDGARLYADVLGLPLGEPTYYPSPRALAELAADRVRAGDEGEVLHPLYLRRPDAVESSAVAGRGNREPGAPKLVRQ
jgi:hypothetical protein